MGRRSFLNLVRLLARCRARSVPEFLRVPVHQSWQQRWTGMLAVAAQRSFAASLLELPLHSQANRDGNSPGRDELLSDARWTTAPAASRLA